MSKGKGKIPIGVAKNISEAYDCPMVILFGLSVDGKTFHLTTYGETKSLCKVAAGISERIADQIINGHISPAMAERPTGGEPIQEEGLR